MSLIFFWSPPFQWFPVYSNVNYLRLFCWKAWAEKLTYFYAVKFAINIKKQTTVGFMIKKFKGKRFWFVTVRFALFYLNQAMWTILVRYRLRFKKITKMESLFLGKVLGTLLRKKKTLKGTVIGTHVACKFSQSFCALVKFGCKFTRVLGFIWMQI